MNDDDDDTDGSPPPPPQKKIAKITAAEKNFQHCGAMEQIRHTTTK